MGAVGPLGGSLDVALHDRAGQNTVSHESLYSWLTREAVWAMHYSLHEVDNQDIVATTTAGDRDEALEWFSEKLHLMLTFEGDPADTNYLLDEWPEGLLAHAANPIIPIFIVSAIAAHPSASLGEGAGESIA